MIREQIDLNNYKLKIIKQYTDYCITYRIIHNTTIGCMTLSQFSTDMKREVANVQHGDFANLNFK